MKTIICFPPEGGGNHCKNILEFTEENFDAYVDLYNGRETHGVHAQRGHNLTKEKFEQNNLLLGHFGEVMSLREEISAIDKQWILISPDTYECRSILYERGRFLKLDEYHDHEQIFLYEPHMYNRYFSTPMSDIMNISVYEWFADDIDEVLDRLGFFLSRDIDKDKAKYLHQLWKAKLV